MYKIYFGMTNFVVHIANLFIVSSETLMLLSNFYKKWYRKKFWQFFIISISTRSIPIYKSVLLSYSIWKGSRIIGNPCKVIGDSRVNSRVTRISTSFAETCNAYLHRPPPNEKRASAVSLEYIDMNIVHY